MFSPDDVVVGPWCIIGEGVKIGRGTRLFGRVTLEGPLVIGAPFNSRFIADNSTNWHDEVS